MHVWWLGRWLARWLAGWLALAGRPAEHPPAPPPPPTPGWRSSQGTQRLHKPPVKAEIGIATNSAFVKSALTPPPLRSYSFRI